MCNCRNDAVRTVVGRSFKLLRCNVLKFSVTAKEPRPEGDSSGYQKRYGEDRENGYALGHAYMDPFAILNSIVAGLPLFRAYPDVSPLTAQCAAKVESPKCKEEAGEQQKRQQQRSDWR